MMCEPSASLKERGFSAAWNDIRAMRENIMVPAKCTACRFRNICEACPAVCFAENGRFDAEPTFMCKKWTHIHGLQQNITKEDNYGGSLCK